MGANLDTRLQDRAQNGTNGTNGRDVVTSQLEQARQLRDKVARMELEFAKAMAGDQAKAAQLIRDAYTLINTIPDILSCTPASVLGALMTCAQLDLRVGVLGEAYVLPYKDRTKGISNAQFVLGYKGIVKLGHRSGMLTSIGFRPVYAKDVFDCDYGTGEITHKPTMEGDPGEAVAYYAMVRYLNGGRDFFFMNRHQALAFRDKHASGKSGNSPWFKFFDEMAGKTCLKRLGNTMPLSPQLAIALAADESVRTDVNPEANVVDVSTNLDVIDGIVVERQRTSDPNPLNLNEEVGTRGGTETATAAPAQTVPNTGTKGNTT